MTKMEWLLEQVDWLKSFVSEPRIKAQPLKGSSKRVIALFLTISFIFEYNRLGDTFIKRIFSLADEQFVLLLNTDSYRMIDVPEYWLILLGGVLGIGIIDYVYKKKKIKAEEVDTELSEHKEKIGRQTQNLHKRIKELESNKK